MHKSIGAIIRNERGEILMIDRKKKPFGWACPSGHIDEGELPEDAMVREVYEETGLEVLEYDLVHHEFIDWNICSHDVEGHDWYVFVVTRYDGELNIESEEVNDYEWVADDDLEYMELEEIWQLWCDTGLL